MEPFLGGKGSNRLQGRLATRAGGYGRCSKHVGRHLSSWARTHGPSQSDEVLAAFAGLVPGCERTSERESKGADGTVMAFFGGGDCSKLLITQ